MCCHSNHALNLTQYSAPDAKLNQRRSLALCEKWQDIPILACAAAYHPDQEPIHDVRAFETQASSPVATDRSSSLSPPPSESSVQTEATGRSEAPYSPRSPTQMAGYGSPPFGVSKKARLSRRRIQSSSPAPQEDIVNEQHSDLGKNGCILDNSRDRSPLISRQVDNGVSDRLQSPAAVTDGTNQQSRPWAASAEAASPSIKEKHWRDSTPPIALPVSIYEGCHTPGLIILPQKDDWDLIRDLDLDLEVLNTPPPSQALFPTPTKDVTCIQGPAPNSPSPVPIVKRKKRSSYRPNLLVRLQIRLRIENTKYRRKLLVAPISESPNWSGKPMHPHRRVLAKRDPTSPVR